MTAGDWFTLQLLAAVLAAAFGVASAALLFVDSTFATEELAPLRARLGRWLQALRASPLADLPGWFLGLAVAARQGLRRLAVALTEGRAGSVVAWVAALACLVVGVVRFGFGPYYVFVAWILLTPVRKALPERIGESRPLQWLDSGVFLAFALLGFFALLDFAVRLAGSWAGPLLALPLPAVGLVLAAFALDMLPGPEEELGAPGARAALAYTLGLGLGLSALATVSAVALGHLTEAAAAQPTLSLRALAVNLAADTLTLLGCAALLRRAWPLLLHLLLGLAWAAATACTGLWLAFAGTPDALAPAQVLRVLVGLSPGGGGLELGSYFFLMHTTFLPLFGLALFLLFAGVLKLAAAVAGALLGASAKPGVSPFKVAAGLLGVLIALFAGLATVAGLLKDQAPTTLTAPR